MQKQKLTDTEICKNIKLNERRKIFFNILVFVFRFFSYFFTFLII